MFNPTTAGCLFHGGSFNGNPVGCAAGLVLASSVNSMPTRIFNSTLIYDVMVGDPTLFMRADMVEQTWRIVQPVLDAWAEGGEAVCLLPAEQGGL